MSDKVEKNSKFVKAISSLNNENDENEEEYIDYDYDDQKHHDYLMQSIEYIQKTILKYVEDKSLCLCEYLNEDIIEDFLAREVLF